MFVDSVSTQFPLWRKIPKKSMRLGGNDLIHAARAI